MGLFSGSSSEENREKRFRKAYEQAVSRHYTPLRKQYVGRSFAAGPYVAKVDKIDDEGNVLLSFHRPDYQLLYVTVLSWQEFTQALASGRLVACEGGA